MRLVHVVGARPNFMKIAPIIRAVSLRSGNEQLLVHTGQHYDASMSDVFFSDLGIPSPDVSLGVGSGSHAEQTAKVMLGFERVCIERSPDVVVVVGDVNSTLAAALVCAKLRIRCAHVEAGLRSFDMDMPEEINRLVTDRVADLLLTPSADADANLLAEGIAPERIIRVGNVMIDTLLQQLPRALATRSWDRLGVKPGAYVLTTLHRPSNVDSRDTLDGLLQAIDRLQAQVPVVFPLHPRTAGTINSFGWTSRINAMSNVRWCAPLGYLEFLALTARSWFVLTDSGGLQEETTALGIPCLTLRDTTERPVTVSEGTNTVVGTSPERILASAESILRGGGKAGRVPELWDGLAGERIAATLLRA